jgi:NADPH:quinone reductase-like Zn-dependent oxidoreductase
MKAIRIHTFGEPEVMQLEEVPDPQPGLGQVVVRVHAVGVNPVETYISGFTNLHSFVGSDMGCWVYEQNNPLPHRPDR